MQEKPFWKMDTHEKIEACESKKHDGNLLFRAGKYWRASKKYEKASRHLLTSKFFWTEKIYVSM